LCLVVLGVCVVTVHAALRASGPRAQARIGAAQEVLRVQRLELVEASGGKWGELGVSADGSRGLRIYDEGGALRMEVVVRPSGSGVYVHEVRAAAPASPSAAGEPRAPSGTSPTGPADHGSLSASSGG
jgi:hypothetical protein